MARLKEVPRPGSESSFEQLSGKHEKIPSLSLMM